MRQTFRFNDRDDSDAVRFRSALHSVRGRRLTDKEVTGKCVAR
jgi:hypothetical protein